MPVATNHKPHSPRRRTSVSSSAAADKAGRKATLDNDDLAATFDRRQQGTDEIQIGGSVKVDGELTTATMADVAKLIEAVKYLVRGWIPFGMATGFIAEPGVCKSAFALWLAFIIMTGRNWFTGAKGPKASHVLWCPTENDMAITLHRMKQWNIPFEKFLLPFGDDPLRAVDLLNTAHLARIEALICKYQPLAIFVDSLRGSYEGDENNSRVCKVLQNLGAIAERTKVAAAVVHHTRKLLPGEEVSANSSRGSNAILALFRAQLGFDRPDPASDWVRVRMLKENLGVAPEPFGLRVTDSGLEFGIAPVKPGKDTQKAKAVDWLRWYLADGEWHLRNDVVKDAEQFGFSENAIQRAREELGIVLDLSCIRQRADKLYEWRMPPTGR